MRGQIHAATEARDLARAARARPRVRRSHSPRLGCAAHTSPLTITEFRAKAVTEAADVSETTVGGGMGSATREN